MTPRLTVLGNINLDYSLQVDRLPAPGENVLAEGLELVPGGKGANQATAAARLGAEVFLLGTLGADSYGKVLRRRLSHEGVNVKYVHADEDHPTGMAFVFFSPSLGQNSIVSLLGANLAGTPERVEQAHRAFERADFFLTSLGVPEDTINRALQISSDCQVPILLDPSPLGKKPPQLWSRARVLCPNQTEASRLSGQNITDPQTAVAAARRMAKRGPEHIVITLGAQGALLFDAEGPRLIPGFKVEVVDPTGAGDAFSAALALRLAEESTLEEAVTFAAAAGALACTIRGAGVSLPTRDQVEALLKRARRDKKPTVKAVS